MADTSVEDRKVDKLKPRIPLKVQECADIRRLSKAYPTIPVTQEGTVSSSVGSSTDRNRLFKWWFCRETRDHMGTRSCFTARSERPRGFRPVHPIMVADSFIPSSTVEEDRIADDRAKAEQTMTVPKVVAPIQEGVVKRMGWVILIGCGIIALGYFFTQGGTAATARGLLGA
jgi:hypothetical protein